MRLKSSYVDAIYVVDNFFFTNGIQAQQWKKFVDRKEDYIEK